MENLQAYLANKKIKKYLFTIRNSVQDSTELEKYLDLACFSTNNYLAKEKVM